MGDNLFKFSIAVLLMLCFSYGSAYSSVDGSVSGFWEQQYLEMEQEIKAYKTAAKKAYRESDLLDNNAQILPEDKTPAD